MEILYLSLAILFVTAVVLLWMFNITEKDRQYVQSRSNAVDRNQETFTMKTK